MQSPMETQTAKEAVDIGRWIAHLRMDKIEGEEMESPFDRVSRTVQSDRWKDILHPWGPMRSENADGVLCFIARNVIGEEGVFNQGVLVREALGEYGSKVHLYYKTNGEHSDYRLSKKGIFSKYQPEEKRIWKHLRSIFPEVTDLEDHSGLWIIHFPDDPRIAANLKKIAKAKLVAAHNSEKVELWHKSVEFDDCPLVCFTDDDRDPEDIYLQGMEIRRALGELDRDIEMFYKKRWAIDQGKSSAGKDEKIYDYRLSNYSVFYQRNRSGVGEEWEPLSLSQIISSK